MGRDEVISKRVFGTIEGKHSTPVRGLLVMAAVTMAGSLVFRFQMAVELLNFGALSGFMLVNLSVVRHYYVRLKQREGKLVLENLVYPLLGAGVCGFLWLNLTNQAKLAGFGWLALGLLYLAVTTRGFRREPKTIESFEEDASDAG
jgi:amino acid transporter